MSYKKVSDGCVSFGYKFNDLSSLFFKKDELVNRISLFCNRNNMDLETTVFICEDNLFILDISVSK